MSQPKWVTVHQTISEHESQIIKLALESEGIPVMVFNQRDSSYNAFGFIYLQVPVDREKEANKIVNNE